LAKYGKAKEF